MIRLDLIAMLAAALTAAACSDSSIPTSPSVREVHYAGTVNQPAPGGTLIYRISGVWKIDGNGALLSGADTTQIIDASVYGVQGTSLIVGKTRCITIIGKDAWAESDIVFSSNPQIGPAGSVGLVRISSTGGSAKGSGGPKDALYPAGNLCTDHPAAMPLFDFQNGSVTIP